MLVIAKKSGGGIHGEGIFHFGKILLKKVLNSNLAKQASKAINSELGQTAIKVVKKAADSDLGQALKERAISEVKKKALEATDKALEYIPASVKETAQTELGQQLQKKIVSEVRKRARGTPVEDIAKATFERLGVAEPQKKRKKRNTRRKKGRGYPQELLDQFGNGIVLE